MRKSLNKIVAKYRLALLFTLQGMILFSCEGPVEEKSFYDRDIFTITDFIELNKEKYSCFWKIIETAQLKDPLTAYNPHGDGFTLFLPTDEAFEQFIVSRKIYSSFEQMLEDVDYVRLLGRYHLVNKSFNTNEFPYGALPDTTASGDFLTIGFSSSVDSTYYKVNNTAQVEIPNIQAANGYIHVVGGVLDPIAYDSFEWLSKNEGFSILSELFETTGLNDTMGIYRHTQNGQLIKNRYTVLAEHDSIYHRNGINSIDDLLNKYGTVGLPATDPDNELYQFAAYHLLEGSYFLDEFTGSTNYNTYANYPVNINAGLNIRINQGVDTFRYELIDGDTIAINYISLYYQQSNQLTKNGAVHMISEVLELFRPSRSTRTFQFYEEPQIARVRNIFDVHEFVDVNNFEVISWSGPENIFFVKVAGDNAANNDYLMIRDNFTIEYTIPKLIPGKYKISLNAHSFSQNNATVMVYIDGKKIGGNIDLTTGGKATNPYKAYYLGSLEFSSYKEHRVMIKALIPGQFIWDYISFIPE
ncbi:MAG: fasciclin domain-containing protein [Prolixibacteraceae bacterium]|jgi:uncharacterized surface protein with fasciclin (FAS1) repeats|nr:fasciclin domain-containing protein [Prolixibacteraceae bacterium]